MQVIFVFKAGNKNTADIDVFVHKVTYSKMCNNYVYLVFNIIDQKTHHGQ